MNKFYRVVWCFVKKAYVVCSELGKQRKKNTTSTLVAASVALGMFSPMVMAEGIDVNPTVDFYWSGQSGQFNDEANWGSDIQGKVSFETDGRIVNDNVATNNQQVVLHVQSDNKRINVDYEASDYFGGDPFLSNKSPNTVPSIAVDIGDNTSFNLKNPSLPTPGSPGQLFDMNGSSWSIGGNSAQSKAILNITGINDSSKYLIFFGPAIVLSQLSIGTESTHGLVDINGGILSSQASSQSGMNTSFKPLTDLQVRMGSGAGSHGEMLIRGGGEFVSSTYNIMPPDIDSQSYTAENPNSNISRTAILNDIQQKHQYFDGTATIDAASSTQALTNIGMDGGTGHLTIDNENIDENTSHAILDLGTNVGVGTGSKGTITVKNGGLLYASAITSPLIRKDDGNGNLIPITTPTTESQRVDSVAASTALRLGVDGGYGHLEVDGAKSHAYFGGLNNGKFNDKLSLPGDKNIGEFNIGISGIGELTLSDGGSVSIGKVGLTNNYHLGGVIGFDAKVYETDPNTHVSIDTGDVHFGKTVLATDTHDAVGVINFGSKAELDANGHLIVQPSNKSAGHLNTSDISVGLGQGILNFNHNGTDDNPFVFDINTHETLNSNYHFGDNVDKIGQISVNVTSGTTLFQHAKDENGIDVNPIGSNVAFNPGDAFFDYSGDTNILGGTLQAKDDNILSLNSDFKTSGSGKLHLINTDQRLKGLYNLGTVQMGDDNLATTDSKLSLDKANEKTLTVTNDYSGGGEIILNALWGQSGAQTSDFYVDKIMIEGDSLASNPTIVTSRNGHSVASGPIDALSDFWLSEPFIAIEGTDHNIAQSQSFLGQINAKKEGYASKYSILALTPQYASNDNGEPIITYNWTNTVHDRDGFTSTNRPILPEEVSLILQMPYANIEQGAAAIGQYFDRFGTASPCNSGNCDLTEKPAWVRSYGNQQEHEANRFSFKSNLYGIQAGKSVWNGKVGNTQMEAGLMAGYSMNDMTFKDDYRTTWGSAVRVDDKETGKGTSSMFTVGAYNTMALENGVYVDTIAQVSSIQNKYKPKSMAEISQSGTLLGLSFEVGKDISLGQSNWHVTPQAQVTFQNINLSDKDYVDSAGDTITLKGEKSTFTRARIGAKWQRIVENQPTFYFKTDLWRQFSAYDLMADTEYIGESNNNKYGEMWTDVGIGFNKKINQKLNIRADVSYQQALSGEKRSGFQANAGVRYNW